MTQDESECLGRRGTVKYVGKYETAVELEDGHLTLTKNLWVVE